MVLTVDEVQGLKPEGRPILEDLHLGLHRCPILLFGIGRQHTLRVLESGDSRAGLSRPATRLRLGTMAPDEAEGAITGALQALGDDIPRPVAAALAQMSQGFPQHVHGTVGFGIPSFFDDMQEQIRERDRRGAIRPLLS